LKSFLIKIYYLIPVSKRKKLPIFFLYSFLNTILDFISIVYLVPLILILLDRNKVEKLALTYLNIDVDNKLIVTLLITLIIFYLLKNSIQSVIIKLQSKYIYSISAEISSQLMSEFISQHYKNYTNSDKNVFFRDVFQLPMTFATTILFSLYIIFSESIILTLLILIGLFYNPIITISCVLLLLSLTYLLVLLQKKKVDFFNLSIVELYQENVKNIQNIFQGFIEIKTTQSEERFKEKFNQTNKKNNQQLALLTAFKQSNGRYFEILFVIGISIVTLFFILSKDSISQLIVLSFFAGASIKIFPSFNKILNAFLDIKANRNVVEILSNHPKVKPKIETKFSFNHSVELKKIDFKFENRTVLNAVNLKVNQGDFISISGNSGEGKSTLLQIIAGLQKPNNGSILVDNVTVKSNQLLSNGIGYASQQPFLFHGSILENITMLKQNVDEAKVEEIITALDLSDWIKSLPNGINSPLLLESKQLSGGQKQRIALARIIYFGSTFLLLDEATNQLDETVENKILHYLKNSNFTVVAVSHSEKITQFANKKYRLFNGDLIENE
jgi:ATP-binding cassette, subfamily B, bacterial PglK